MVKLIAVEVITEEYFSNKDYSMFEAEKQQVTQKIQAFCQERGLPDKALEWRDIPFSGEWGMAAPLFPLAAADPARQGPVPQHAQRLAEALAAYLGDLPGFSRIEAVRGYLNLYFSPAEYAQKVVQAILEQGERYGVCKPNGKATMVEYSNPNTHKPLHDGHLRNVILGG